MSENTGGSAFPAQPILKMPHDVQMVTEQGGMTLRDYFAIRAPEPTESMMQIESTRDRYRNPYNEPHKPKLRSNYEIRADLAYEYADAMLAARESKGE